MSPWTYFIGGILVAYASVPVIFLATYLYLYTRRN